MKKNEHLEIEIVRDYDLKVGHYKDMSGLIKDEISSWSQCVENTYLISSAVENSKQRQYIESRHMRVFDYHSESRVSKNGLFYGKFDCRVFDWVEQIHDSLFFICRKDDKYGVIDWDEKIVIDIVYPLITILPQTVDVDIDELLWYLPPHIREGKKKELGENVKPYIVLKITTYDGEYLLEITSMQKSKTYGKIYTFGKNYLAEKHGLYGLISSVGEEIVPPKFTEAWPVDDLIDWLIDEQYREKGAWLQVTMNDRKIPIANNGKYYGEIPIEYEECYRVKRDVYYVKKDGKCGLLEYNSVSKNYRTIIPIEYDSIIFDKHKPFYQLTIEDGEKYRGKRIVTYAIVQDSNGYCLYDLNAKQIASEKFISLDFSYNNLTRILDGKTQRVLYAPCFIAQKKEKYALLSPIGLLVSQFDYQIIKSVGYCLFAVCKDGLWGVINQIGNQLVTCEWDEIVSVYSKSAIVKKEGSQREVSLEIQQPQSRQRSRISSSNRPTYERYNGSYAQDEMGYSDDEIDTIFEGDPSAYWNID